MSIVAIDPGSSESAWVFYSDKKPKNFGKWENESLVDWLATSDAIKDRSVHVVIEMVASYGMPVGAEVFETCVWIGRMIEAVGRPVERVFRKDVKMTLCGKTAGVNDGVIRQRLIDIYGPGRERAIGKKKSPGPLYGISSDVWQALALAVVFEKMKGAA